LANPQKENGYTPIANEILDKIVTIPINGTQFRIVMIIWRYTYGFSRREHIISEKFIATAGDINKKQVQRELTELIKLNIIHVLKEATFTEPRLVQFNKNYDSWLVTNQRGGNGLEVSPGSELAVSPLGDDFSENETKFNNTNDPLGEGANWGGGSQLEAQDKQIYLSIKTNGSKTRDSVEVPFEETKKLHNTICVSLPKVRGMTEKRKKALKARWIKYKKIEVFEAVFKLAEKSDFLSGRNGKWTNCGFDWLINENNMVKVLEGNYNNKSGGQNGRAGIGQPNITISTEQSAESKRFTDRPIPFAKGTNGTSDIHNSG